MSLAEPPVWLWVVFTLVAACSQTFRNAMQRSLTARLGTVGATHVRFLFGLPFACVFVVLILATAPPLREPRFDRRRPIAPQELLGQTHGMFAHPVVRILQRRQEVFRRQRRQTIQCSQRVEAPERGRRGPRKLGQCRHRPPIRPQ